VKARRDTFMTTQQYSTFQDWKNAVTTQLGEELGHEPTGDNPIKCGDFSYEFEAHDPEDVTFIKVEIHDHARSPQPVQRFSEELHWTEVSPEEFAKRLSNAGNTGGI
jgi:hypothetical protein